MVKCADKWVNHTALRMQTRLLLGADLENEIMECRVPRNGSGCFGPMGYDVSEEHRALLVVLQTVGLL